ncbi:hypothetical protein BP00DRAFT_442130 [Aspergillus indologenus CBS 114.80]|uniref:MFS general substrate transporter n=1 Tax=Aspergillus indologenus CBS 114.80 TaxID=1450541 RepID=A0A2V5ILC7_9EURO|nr:hypothetical protein BP00DRAFT_442130 [Aspergillus indologenus CBS 114.80]
MEKSPESSFNKKLPYSITNTAQETSVGEFAEFLAPSPEVERWLLWKLDLFLIPTMGICYMLQYMDKLALSQATLLNRRQDLGLHGSQYTWCSAIFYFGYLAWSWPTSYLIVRLPLGKYLAISVSAIIVTGFGYSSFKSLLLQMSVGAAQLVFLIITAAIATFIPSSRILSMVLNVVVAIVGVALIYTLNDSQKVVKPVGLSFVGAFAVNIRLALSIISSNVAGRTKRSTVSSAVFAAYCVGNIVGPQFFLASEEPVYATGIRASLCRLALGVLFLGLLSAYYVWENRRRDALYGHVDNPHHLHLKLRPLDEIVDVPDYMREYCSGPWHIDSAERHAFRINDDDDSFLRRDYLARGIYRSDRHNSWRVTEAWRKLRGLNFFVSAAREVEAAEVQYAPKRGPTGGPFGKRRGQAQSEAQSKAQRRSEMAEQEDAPPSYVAATRQGHAQSEAQAKAKGGSEAAEQEHAPPSYEDVIGLGRRR